MRRKALSIVALIFFACGLIITLLQNGEGVFVYYHFHLLEMKAYQIYVDILLYGAATLLSILIIFRSTPKKSKLIYIVLILALVFAFGYELYTELMFGLFMFAGDCLEYVAIVFYLVGLYLSLHLFYCLGHKEKGK